MLMTLPQEFASRFEADGLQAVELLIQMLGSNSHSWFHDLGQPLAAMAGSIDRRARARNGPAAIERLDPVHGASDLFTDCEITAPQFSQGAEAMLSVVDGVELVGA